VFRRHFPIHRFFERSCELGVFRLSADQITQIFGFRKHKRLRGKFHSMLEKVDHGHHVNGHREPRFSDQPVNL
jgi:hypothetical protein